jgi:hypothetical protein
MKRLFAPDRLPRSFPLGALIACLFLVIVAARIPVVPLRAADQIAGLSLMGQTQLEADRKSAGCISCHTQTDEPTMHATGTLRLGCTDCHGGNADVRIAAGVTSSSPEYDQVKRQAHPQPRDPGLANRSANPERAYTQWLKESPEYVRFVNPGDLRIATETCGSTGCHTSEIRNVSTSMMTTGGLLWGAALYNNGGYPHKDTRFGESYARDGAPQTVRTIPPPTPEEIRKKGVLAEITPLERWEVSQPGNVLRVFERGGGPKGEVGEPVRADDAGKPDNKLGTRGFGTQLRTDPVFLGLQKTRLLDPLLSMPGTNDQPGDYRASGFTRTIARRNTPRSTRRLAIAASAPRRIQRFRATSRDIRSATSSRARSRRANAWCATSTRERI